MKRLNVLLATVLACGAVEITAQRAALPPANLPPPFPRAGAKQLLENDRVTVWDVVWPKGQPTAHHRHPYALAGVYLEPGTRVITDAEGSKRNVTNEAGGITFQLKGLTHVEEGTSDAPLHAIMIELKQDAPVGDDPSADLPPAFPREGAKQLLENDRVRVWDYTFTPHRVGPLHRHVRRRLAGRRQAESNVARRHVERQHADQVHGNVFQARRRAHGRSHRRRTARLCL